MLSSGIIEKRKKLIEAFESDMSDEGFAAYCERHHVVTDDWRLTKTGQEGGTYEFPDEVFYIHPLSHVAARGPKGIARIPEKYRQEFTPEYFCESAAYAKSPIELLEGSGTLWWPCFRFSDNNHHAEDKWAQYVPKIAAWLCQMSQNYALDHIKSSLADIDIKPIQTYRNFNWMLYKIRMSSLPDLNEEQQISLEGAYDRLEKINEDLIAIFEKHTKKIQASEGKKPALNTHQSTYEKNLWEVISLATAFEDTAKGFIDVINKVKDYIHTKSDVPDLSGSERETIDKHLEDWENNAHICSSVMKDYLDHARKFRP